MVLRGSGSIMAGSAPALQATWHGFVPTTIDALLLFEACLQGVLQHVPRRPHDRERENLIRSGCIFVYEEHCSGIKRWTDGLNWSPSRILGNFLIYRELDHDLVPGEKKKALKRPKKNGAAKSTNNGRSGSTGGNSTENEDRAYIGSLTDSYPFKEGGLVKKTISVNWNGIPHHLVSYYTVADAKSANLDIPTGMDMLNHLMPRPGLIQGQNFRAPIDNDGSDWDEQNQAHAQAQAALFAAQQPMEPNPYAMLPTPRTMSVPGPIMHYGQAPSPYTIPGTPTHIQPPMHHHHMAGGLGGSQYLGAMPQQFAHSSRHPSLGHVVLSPPPAEINSMRRATMAATYTPGTTTPGESMFSMAPSTPALTHPQYEQQQHDAFLYSHRDLVLPNHSSAAVPTPEFSTPNWNLSGLTDQDYGAQTTMAGYNGFLVSAPLEQSHFELHMPTTEVHGHVEFKVEDGMQGVVMEEDEEPPNHTDNYGHSGQ